MTIDICDQAFTFSRHWANNLLSQQPIYLTILSYFLQLILRAMSLRKSTAGDGRDGGGDERDGGGDIRDGWSKLIHLLN